LVPKYLKEIVASRCSPYNISLSLIGGIIEEIDQDDDKVYILKFEMII